MRPEALVQAILIVVELVVAVALVVTVLLQRSEGGALGMGGGGSGLGGLFSPRGAADTLTRTTAVLAVLFFLTCLALNLLALHGRERKSILDSPAAPPTTTLPVQKPSTPPAKPAGPVVPTPH
jgi:preprotein translocase subunit SecG